ncbi:Retrovirus-related Pol polyprotein from transposon 17.6 [Cucumis melo var. makuwa]|uniref:Retrovirus-related Pol polyprotein from transposon 17.6 n=1 Tax=Cucumis melo var. makuwa TaxID=1194695 RepID=A0A5A7VKX7_CUCMM|nr:Retrovirus-related Pol polyprotein from transposon 17.6 [Cucumis melo var. makuwa]
MESSQSQMVSVDTTPLLGYRVSGSIGGVSKCNFCMENVNFLSFIVGKNGVKVDEEKVKAIKEWPTPKVTSKGEKQEKALNELKEKLTNAPSLVFPNFGKTFKLSVMQVVTPPPGLPASLDRKTA